MITQSIWSVMRPSRFRLSFLPCLTAFIAWMGVMLVLMGAGCSTLGGPGTESVASVTIRNHTVQDIVTTTAQVFAADGYLGAMAGSGQLVFEKAASGLTTLSRDGLVAAHSGARTIKRVRVDIVNLGDGSHQLHAKAYLVTGGSDPFFQDEVPLSITRSGPYWSLLNKVANQLK